MDNTEIKDDTMRAQFEAWWETTERDVSFPHEAARSAYQAALSSPAVVALMDAGKECGEFFAHYSSVNEACQDNMDEDCSRVLDLINAALATFTAGAGHE